MATVIGKNSRGGLDKISERVPRVTSKVTNTAGEKIVNYSDGSKTRSGLGSPTPQPNASGSITDLSIALANQNKATAPVSGSGSIKDLSIGLAKGNKITQEDITSAQSGGASLQSRVAPTLSTPSSTSTVGGGASTPTGSNQTAVGTGKGKKDYYSRYSTTEEDPVVDVPSPESYQKQYAKNAQAQINSLYKFQADQLAEQQGINQKNDRSTASVSTLSGLAGSSEANVAQQETTKQGQQANNAIRNQVETKVQSVLAQVRADAMEQYRYDKSEARLATAEARVAQTAREERATKNAALLSASGATADGYKQTDPEGYAHLAKSVGGEDMLKAMFTLNRPLDQVKQRIIQGGKLMQIYENPLTGETRIETMDTGLPPQYSKTLDAGNRILAIPDDWDGDPSKLVTINKGLTPSQSASQSSSSTSTPSGGDFSKFPEDIRAAAQSIYDGKTKLNEYPSAKRLQINSAMSTLYTSEGGDQLAQGAYDAITELETHPGFHSAIGAKGISSFFGMKGAPIPGTSASGFNANLDKLKANIKLVNTKYLKGTGALSDAEGKTLEDAGTSLNSSLPEADFTKELKRVKDVLIKANNVKQTAPSPIQSEGSDASSSDPEYNAYLKAIGQ